MVDVKSRSKACLQAKKRKFVLNEFTIIDTILLKHEESTSFDHFNNEKEYVFQSLSKTRFWNKIKQYFFLRFVSYLKKNVAFEICFRDAYFRKLQEIDKYNIEW